MSILTGGATSHACAEGLADIFSVSGFGTLGVTHSSLDTADFASTAFEPNGAGHSRRYDVTGDSTLGVQVNAQFTDKLSAVVQVVSVHRYDNTFQPEVEWANVKYAFTPDFSVRVGRIELPTFLTSDYRDVGYANPWVRVPAEVYNNEPITHSDGADLSYRMHLGSVSNTVRILYGYSTFHINPGAYRTTGQGIVGLFDTVEYGAVTARIGYMHGTVTLGALGYKTTSSVYSAALAYDPGSWFLQAEVARVTTQGLTPGYLSGYLTAGYRVGHFTPYVTYAQAHSLGNPTLGYNTNTGQRDLSAGVRWDVYKNVDLKLQFDHVWLPSNSTGSFVNVQPQYRLGTGTNVMALVLDFVF
ncbi:hypothetical protein OVY01_20205 [Robbsia sp. Bb-Pol-6]|uniref:Porin n=1 Tax=Robbsia betulipollinis TaxID=2981849 RepID=A0ABT3ZSF4_9BURK|nr:hypothetical protein [Robbsia betulipollinis]MCY0389471.1 hypothetical protein [Robbsia betulipollinis]